MEIDNPNNKRAESSIVKPPAKRQWMSNTMEFSPEISEEKSDTQYLDGALPEEYQQFEQPYENNEGQCQCQEDDNQDFQEDTTSQQLT